MDPPGQTAAVQYLRMSTEQQCYSFGHQSVAIARYAATHGYQIKRTYQDAARSGLQLKGRAGLQTLLSEVLREDRDFSAILVLDVTRWGRFQDLDQGAHYEFICRAAGVSVIYCAEPFENDGSTKSALIKQLKRLMAAEYSRELSGKTKAAHLLQAKLGHRQGGPTIYGVQRVIVDRNGCPIGELPRGRWKAQHDNYVRLRPGPKRELQVLRWIFRRFLCSGCTASSVARELNEQGVPYIGARLWGPDSLTRLLKHELMIGVYVYNRTSHLLKGAHIHNPPQEWVRCQVFEPIIPQRLFRQVQAKLRDFARPRHDREELLSALRVLLKKHGRLSASLIKQSPETPCVGAYQKHFGALTAAYDAVGYTFVSSSTQRPAGASRDRLQV
jgi:DNA invertase Pin-like site-specific DNA recombinase